MIPRLFIVDDEAPARVRLATLLSDIAAECPHVLVGEAANGQDALLGIAATKPDIVLLDVQMPGMTGVELAARLLQQGAEHAPAVVFVSAYDEYALKAFDVHAFDYLLKPVRATRLAEALQRTVALRGQPAPQSDALPPAASTQPLNRRRLHFSVQERDRLLLVSIADVLYLKAEQKYVTLRTRLRDFLIEESLVSIEEEMADTFVRVHRNALVARNAIIGVERGSHALEFDGETEKTTESWQVILRDVSDRLPISRRQWPIIKALVR
jgi:two-component system response regulator AlgR